MEEGTKEEEKEVNREEVWQREKEKEDEIEVRLGLVG